MKHGRAPTANTGRQVGVEARGRCGRTEETGAVDATVLMRVVEA
jgi:hypothetical protein